MAYDSDDFNRANSATSAGSTAGGRPWTPLDATTAWGISSNQLYCPDAEIGTGSGSYGSRLVADFGISDCVIEADLPTVHYDAPPPTGVFGMGLCWRASDDTHYFYLIGNSVYRNFGSGAGLQTTGPSFLASGDHIKIELNGSAHTIYRNGSLWVTFTQSGNATNTKHGFFSDEISHLSRADNFTIELLKKFPLRLFPRNDDLDGPRLSQFSDSAQRSTRLGGTTYS